MITLYRIVGYIFYLLVYRYGKIRAMAGDPLWQWRLCLDNIQGPVDLWLHAASVGEVRIINYLIQHLRRKQKSLNIHVTVMTRTGYQTAKTIFTDDITISFLPFDTPKLMNRKINQIKPKKVVIAETELWPNLILELSDAHIPLVLVNGRMTEKALKRYLWFKSSFVQFLSMYDRLFVKSEVDCSRYITLGAKQEKCEIVGDMKFDAPLIDRSEEKRKKIRQTAGMSDNEFLFVAGSTRPGEEEILLDTYQSLRKEFDNVRLVLVPRHVERATEISMLVQQKGFIPEIFDSQTNHSPDSVIVVDKMGILTDLYLSANLAFVGGTLVNIGGHNLLEPVWAGTPVLFGTSLTNVEDASLYIQQNNFGIMVKSPDELTNTIRDFIQGKRKFKIKTADDLEHSPTAHIADYILGRLNHA